MAGALEIALPEKKCFFFGFSHVGKSAINPVQIWFWGEFQNGLFGFVRIIIIPKFRIFVAFFHQENGAIFLTFFKKFWTFNFELSISGTLLVIWTFIFIYLFIVSEGAKRHVVPWIGTRKRLLMNASVPLCLCDCCLFSCFGFPFGRPFTHNFQLFPSWNLQSKNSFTWSYLLSCYNCVSMV